MMQIVEQSREEKLAMYQKLSKKELATLVVNCNEIIDKFCRNQPPYFVAGQQAETCIHDWVFNYNTTSYQLSCSKCGTFRNNVSVGSASNPAIWP